MNATVNTTQPSTSIAIITKTAHGLTIPVGDKLMGVYVDSVTGDILPSDASLIDTQTIVFVTEIIDVDTIRVQTTGFFTSIAHGYLLGEYYFITDTGDGGFSATPGTVNDVGFFVFDNNVLLLIDNRAV